MKKHSNLRIPLICLGIITCIALQWESCTNKENQAQREPKKVCPLPTVDQPPRNTEVHNQEPTHEVQADLGALKLGKTEYEWLDLVDLSTVCADSKQQVMGKRYATLGFVYKNDALSGRGEFGLCRKVRSCTDHPPRIHGYTVMGGKVADLSHEQWVRVCGRVASLKGEPLSTDGKQQLPHFTVANRYRFIVEDLRKAATPEQPVLQRLGTGHQH